MTEPREPTDQLCIGATDMTDNTQPEALRLADALEYCDASVARQAINELRRQHARIAELEAQLEAIRAGGVSGPLMGKPQAMPDLSALTERGAEAWAGVDAQGLREGAANAGSEPVAWIWKYANGEEEVVFVRPERVKDMHPDTHDMPSKITPLYLHPSPPEGMVAAQALRKVLSVVQRYLPPDGPTAHDAMTEITEIVDPWPLGPLEKP